tara:strand:+ start:841 stop:1074 length:234 start_codon:yes stop_codon:yes gene_type:complete
MAKIIRFTKGNFAKKINPHKRVQSHWIAHVNEQKKYEPIIYDCGAFAIQRLNQKSKVLLEHEETLRVLQEFEDLYNN